VLSSELKLSKGTPNLLMGTRKIALFYQGREKNGDPQQEEGGNKGCLQETPKGGDSYTEKKKAHKRGADHSIEEKTLASPPKERVASRRTARAFQGRGGKRNVWKNLSLKRPKGLPY